MLTILSSFLTGVLNRDQIKEDGMGVLNDHIYLTQIIGFTGMFEIFVETFLLTKWVIKKIARR